MLMFLPLFFCPAESPVQVLASRRVAVHSNGFHRRGTLVAHHLFARLAKVDEHVAMLQIAAAHLARF
jgi:hypothetical protein